MEEDQAQEAASQLLRTLAAEEEQQRRRWQQASPWGEAADEFLDAEGDPPFADDSPLYNYMVHFDKNTSPVEVHFS